MDGKLDNGLTGGDGGTGGTGGAAGTPTGEGGSKEKTYTQDDFDKAIKAEADRRVTEAIKTNNAKWEKSLAEKLQSERDEAARLAKLTADERAAEEQKKARAEFDKERAEFQREKLVHECTKQLAEAKLPVSFADMLTGANAEETAANIKSFAESWKGAIEDSVTKRLSGKKPGAGSGGSAGGTDNVLKSIRTGAGLS